MWSRFASSSQHMGKEEGSRFQIAEHMESSFKTKRFTETIEELLNSFPP